MSRCLNEETEDDAHNVGDNPNRALYSQDLAAEQSTQHQFYRPGKRKCVDLAYGPATNVHKPGCNKKFLKLLDKMTVVNFFVS